MERGGLRNLTGWAKNGGGGSQISGCEHLCCYWVYFNHKPEVTKAPLEDPGFTKPRFPAATGNSNGTLPRELTTLCLVVWRQLDAAFPLGKQRSRLRRGERSSSSALRESTHVHRLLRHVSLCQGCPETPTWLCRCSHHLLCWAGRVRRSPGSAHTRGFLPIYHKQST